MNLLTLRERLSGEQRHQDGLPATKNLTKLLAAHRRVLFVLGRFDGVDAVLGDFVARAAGARVDVVALVILPEWSARTLEQETQERLTRIATEASSSDVRIAGEVRLGEPVTTVLAAATRHEVDLIAMTTHRVGVIDRLLDHSVLEEVVRQSPIPVIATFAPGKTR